MEQFRKKDVFYQIEGKYTRILLCVIVGIRLIKLHKRWGTERGPWDWGRDQGSSLSPTMKSQVCPFVFKPIQ